MATPVRLFIDGVERTGNLDPASIEITRELNQRQSSCSFTVYRQPVGGYYEDPSTLPGVISWWHLDEQSGNLIDAVGGHTLTLQAGSVEYRLSSLAPGYGGTSIRFPGPTTLAHFATASTSAFDLTGALSIGFWVKGMTQQAHVLSFGVATVGVTAANQWRMQVAQQASPSIGFQVKNATVTGFSSAEYAPGFSKRRFIVMTRAAGTGLCKFYVDGVELTPNTPSGVAFNGSAGSAILRLGVADDSTREMTGKIDEVFISSSELSATIVEGLFAQGRDGADFLTVAERSEIVVTNEDASRNRFGGYAVEVYQVREGAFDVGWQVRAVGWENAFESIAIERYNGANKRTDQVISEIFAADARLTGFNLDRVARGKVIDGTYNVRDRYVRDVLDELAEIDADEWWIDADGTHLWKRRANYVHTATPRFSDQPADIDQATVWSYRDFTYTREFRNPANRVLFRGGTRYIEHNPNTFGTGHAHNATWRFLDEGLIVPLEGESEITVQINESTALSPSWSADLVVGRYGRDELIQDGGDKEVLLQPQPGLDKLFFDASKQPPRHSQNAYRVYYRQAYPTRVEVVSQEAYERMGYVHFDRVVYDEKITSTQQARQIAHKMLSQQSRPLESLSLATDLDPDDPDTLIAIGDLVHVANTRHGLDTYEDGVRGYRVVKMCVYLYQGGTIAYSTFDLGTYQPGLLDLLKKLERENSRANDLVDGEEENVELMSGWEGSDQDVNDSIAISDEVVITP